MRDALCRISRAKNAMQARIVDARRVDFTDSSFALYTRSAVVIYNEFFPSPHARAKNFPVI